MKAKISEFLNRETTGGLLLIMATIIALVIANSGIGEDYKKLLEKELVIGFVDELELRLSIKHWINDGLMVIFFLVVGLEIKREFLVGELSSKSSAIMPMIAALGGMVIPATIFIALNAGSETINGWAVPMATDIAYALGIMGLLHKNVPKSLKIFITALAIADDIGAIIVITFFYSSDIAWTRLIVAGAIFAVISIAAGAGLKKLWFYVLMGIVFWICFIHSGIHPTLAGVLLAATIPVKPNMTTRMFHQKAQESTKKIRDVDFERLDPLAQKEQRQVLKTIKKDSENAYPLLLRMEHGLEYFNSYFVIPVFALANAGVKFDIPLKELFTGSLGPGIALGLILGKSIGISGFSFLAEKLKLASLPQNVTWTHIIGMSFIAGIGFTMSLFITNLAFTDQKHIQIAKISILSASFLAAVIGIAILLYKKKV